MFELKEVKATLAHLNLRDEKHGEDTVLAVDVKMTADVTNDFLLMLSPTLKSSLYQREDEAEGQQPLIADAGHMPSLRYPEMGTIPWTGTMSAEFTIHGAKRAKDFTLSGKVNNLKLATKEGGTVAIEFRVQISGPTPQDVAALTERRGDVTISVVPVEDDGAAAGGGDGDGGSGDE